MSSKLNSVLPHEILHRKDENYYWIQANQWNWKFSKKNRRKKIIRYWIPFFQLFGMARNFVANICRVYESLPLWNPIKPSSNVKKNDFDMIRAVCRCFTLQKRNGRRKRKGTSKTKSNQTLIFNHDTHVQFIIKYNPTFMRKKCV